MYKKIISLFILILTPSYLLSHTLLLNVFDNEDNTMTIEGIFNTGQTAPGAQVRLESLVTGKLLYKKRLPDESELTIKIPNEPYQIVLDGGPGHQIIQEGIEPKEGFDTTLTAQSKTVKLSQPRNTMGLPIEMIISVVVAFILIFITMILSIFNTRKLLVELKNK